MKIKTKHGTKSRVPIKKKRKVSKMDATMRLKNMFKLSSKITVYIPSTVDIDKEIDSSAYVDACATLLSNCFGGATSTTALGYWTSPTAGLVTEKSTMVFAYCTTEDLNHHFDKVVDFCEAMKAELKQDAVALELNGEMYFV